MQLEVRVPNLPESVSEATLVAWRKRAGESVRRDEPLTDLETDKVVLEVPAPADGVLTALEVADGATVTAGQLLAVIDTEGAVQAGEVRPLAPDAQAAARESPAPAAAEPVPSPAARKLAADHEVDLRTVPGSGKGGRITKEDVAAHLGRQAAPAPPGLAKAPRETPPPAAPAAAGGRAQRRVPMTRIRARIAERLVAVQREAAILTTFNEVNMHAVAQLRARYREAFEREHGVRLGFMGFFVRAAIAALKRFPLVNASLDGADIVHHDYYDIGVAVAAPRGLVVPVLRDADRLSVAGIERSIGELAAKARDNTLAIEELTGGTFTITNGGVFGSMLSTPILNAPQSAILGMHNIVERPLAEDGQVVIRPVMYLALSYDHRLIDGREAVQFLVAVKQAIEDPARLLLEL
jgi:2-oxoglutarate dehydrogenase E2 component (dihydrolipoamide succinyltransferase)